MTDSGIEQRVHPTMVPLDSVIAQVDGVTNAVAIRSDILGELLMVGPGAGGNATASAVLGDIADIAKSRPGAQQVPVLGRPAKSLTEYRRAKMKSHEGGYFIRLTVKDQAGVFASIATRMADNNISLGSIVQRQRVRNGRRAADHHPRHPCDDGRCDPQGREGDQEREISRQRTAGHPHRADLKRLDELSSRGPCFRVDARPFSS